MIILFEVYIYRYLILLNILLFTIKMSSDKKLMDFKSKEEVAEYMKKENAKGNPIKLIIYDLCVLNVTTFRHPGPAELIADNLGKDI